MSWKLGRERVKEQFKIQVTADNHEVINSSDIVILSVKPQFYAEVIAEIKDDVREDQIIITIAPGKTLAWLKEQFGKNVKIVRTNAKYSGACGSWYDSPHARMNM